MTTIKRRIAFFASWDSPEGDVYLCRRGVEKFFNTSELDIPAVVVSTKRPRSGAYVEIRHHPKDSLLHLVRWPDGKRSQQVCITGTTEAELGLSHSAMTYDELKFLWVEEL